jgi:hypothetical protein
MHTMTARPTIMTGAGADVMQARQMVLVVRQDGSWHAACSPGP